MEIFTQYLAKELKGLKIEAGERKIAIEKDGKIAEIPPILKSSSASSSITGAGAEAVASPLITREYTQ